MRLSWNEIRARASQFVQEWQGATYEKGETQSFYNEFFHIFGVRRRSVARYEEHVRRLDDTRGFIDLFWPGVLLVEQKSAGRDLGVAEAQAGSYFDALPEKAKPRYQLVCDFQTFRLRDRDEDETVEFPLAQLPAQVERFAFIMGVERRSFRDQDPANIEASELMGRLHDSLKANGYSDEDLAQFLVSALFCLFADDTGIFEQRGMLHELILDRTAEDGNDTGAWITRVFQTLNTPVSGRQRTLDADLARLPYVNGDLFARRLRIPEFNAEMRNILIEACEFDWTAISPAVFGSLFQAVMDPTVRRAQGAHYTTQQNILKVIQPLFLDDLQGEFARLQARRDSQRRVELQRFQQRLGEIHILDPACGCGNFLIVAYQELRLLEIEVIRELMVYEGEGQLVLDVAALSHIDVDQFYGIEILEFPVRVAETALWMMDHIMNNRLSLEFGASYVRIPLTTSPHVLHADAHEISWEEFLPAAECSFVLGNPPFAGAKLQTSFQRAQVQRITGSGTLDYVAAWFLRAGEYVQRKSTRIGFVATNSIIQGEQAGQLWPALFERTGLEIDFAHRTFAWGSEARGMAHVHVVIIGLAHRDNLSGRRRLFTYPAIKDDPLESSHTALSPYLVDASGFANPHVVVRSSTRQLHELPPMIVGSKPIDGGHYILDIEERDSLLTAFPDAAPYVRPYVGSREFLHGGDRSVLCLHVAPPSLLGASAELKDRVNAVIDFRLQSKSRPTRKLSETPTLFHLNVLPATPFLVIPRVSNERLKYVPMGWLEPPVVPSDSVLVLQEATLLIFALLTSAMHMTWLGTVGGRLKSDLRYSVGVVYNTFPLPEVSPERFEAVTPLAEAVLAARALFPEETMANLYDPVLMPPALLRAHLELDRAVDSLYSRRKFESERERLEILLSLYEMKAVPLHVRPGRRR